jgi:hypothetical protein
MCNNVQLEYSRRTTCTFTPPATVFLLWQEQYAFIFRSVLEGLILDETFKPLAKFTEFVSELQLINEMTGESVIETEFQVGHLLRRRKTFFKELSCS